MPGESIFGNGRLIRSNCSLDVVLYTITVVNGGTVYGLGTTVASGVEVLFTQLAGGRSPDLYGTDAQKDTGTISGVDAYLNTTNTAFKVVSFPSMTEFEGKYFRVISPQHHPQGLGGLLTQRTSVQVERLDFPIS